MMDIPDKATAQEQTVPYRINYQGRLSDNDGNILPDGNYNLRLKLFDAAAGGNQIWSSEYTGSNRISVAGGQFDLQLGELDSLPPSVFSTYPLHLEVELPTPATATSSSPDWSEGPFTPRQRLASAPYAFNSQQLEGKEASEFAQLDPGSTQQGSIDIAGSIQAGGQLQGSSLEVSGSATFANDDILLGSSGGLSQLGLQLSGGNAQFSIGSSAEGQGYQFLSHNETLLRLDGESSQTTATIQSRGAQSGNILEILDNSGTSVAKFNNDGTVTFTGTVSGADAEASDEFTTLSQLQGTDVSDDAFLQGGNSFGATAELGTTDAQGLSLITNGTERLRVSSNGNVGIGTDTPSSKLAVVGNVRIGSSVASSFGGLTLSDDVNDFNISGRAGRNLRIQEGGNTYIELLANGGHTVFNHGNLGIGTDDPQAVLDVQGDASITEELFLGSASTAGELVFSDGTDFTGTITTAELGQDTTYVLPSASEGSVEVCTSAGNCIPTGTTAGEMWHWDGADWAIVPAGGQGELLTTCDGEPTWRENGECPLPEIGGTGPGGGLIFHIDGDTYYEAAPSDWDGGDDPTLEWGCYGQSVGGADDGESNTHAIVDYHDDDSNFDGEDYYSYDGDYGDIGCSDGNDGAVAAKTVADYDGGGYDDWFLPSRDELDAMYTNLHSQDEGGFSSDPYWSSSEVSANSVWFQTFSNGDLYIGAKFGSIRVRPARTFAPLTPSSR